MIRSWLETFFWISFGTMLVLAVLAWPSNQEISEHARPEEETYLAESWFDLQSARIHSIRILTTLGEEHWSRFEREEASSCSRRSP